MWTVLFYHREKAVFRIAEASLIAGSSSVNTIIHAALYSTVSALVFQTFNLPIY